MEHSKAMDRDFYDELYTSMSAESLAYKETNYKKQRVQNPARRVLNIALIFVLCIGLLTPLTMVVKRQAEIHEKQFGIFRLKEVTADYKDKTNELKEALESNSSLDDLELYATERLDMVKADKNNIIVLKPLVKEINKPAVKFTIASASGLDLKAH